MQTHEKVEIIRLATGPQKPINEYKRFAILVLGSFGCIVCSFSYAWNLIAPTLQVYYDFSQRDMSSIATAGLVIEFAMLPYAFVYDYLGPIPIAALSTVYFPLGTLLLALCFMGKIEGSVVRLCVFNAFMSCGCSLFDLACCITVLSHFPANRGPVAALLKTFTGLGSAIVACLYAGYFNCDPVKHFFFLFVVGVVVGALCIAFMRLPPYHLTGYEMSHLPEEEKERRLATKAQYLRQEAPLRRFVWGFFILIVLIIFLPTQSAVVSYLFLGRTTQLAFAIVTTILTILYLIVAAPVPFLNSSYIPYFHPVHTEMRVFFDDADADNTPSLRTPYDGPDAGASPREHEITEPSLMDSAAHARAREPDAVLVMDDRALAEVSAEREVCQVGDDGKNTVAAADINAIIADANVSSVPSPPPPLAETEVDYLAPQYQGSFFHSLTTLELWALWWTLFTVGGAEFVIISNATFLLTALQSAPVDQSLSAMLTVLNGAGSAVGRLLISYFEVWTQKRKPEDRIPITVALFFSTAAVIISIVLFLTLPARVLPLPYIFAALGNGIQASAVLLVTRTIFAKDPAKHYNFCFTSMMVAAIAYNRFLYGEWYTVQAEKQGRPDKLCYGKGCVLMPLLVMLGLACTAFITDVVVHFRYRSYCIKTLAERARLRDEAAAAATESRPACG